MPHLSPMNWSMMVFMIWMFMLMFSSFNWWGQSMKWSINKYSHKATFNSWKWFF